MIDRARTTPRGRLARRGLFLATCTGVVALGLASGSCYTNSDGNAPSDTRIYYPTGISLSLTGNHVFLVNSDFDLAFNQGTVQALDALLIQSDAINCESALRQNAEQPCRELGSAPPSPAALAMTAASASPPPAPSASQTAAYVQAAVQVGAFAADVLTVPHYTGGTFTAYPGFTAFPTSTSLQCQGASTTAPWGPLTDPADPTTPLLTQGRLLVPVRGDATLTYIDYDETAGTEPVHPITLNCGINVSSATGLVCDDTHRVGDEADNSRDFVLEGEPFALTVSPTVASASDPSAPCENALAGGIAAIAHQSTGDVSVFVNVLNYSGGADDSASDTSPPALAYTVTGLAADATAIATAYLGGAADGGQTPTFLVTNRTQASVYVVRFIEDTLLPDRSALAVSYAVQIPNNSPGSDTRGIVVDPPTPGETRPTRVFLSSRSPGSIVTGQFDPTTEQLSFYDSIALPIGPSRIVRSLVTGPDGKPHTHLYVLSFDSRSLVSYDPDLGQVDSVIHTGRGPYAFAVDGDYDDKGNARAGASHFGYLANFTDMTVQVIDLATKDRNDATKPNPFFEQIVYTVGIPQGPPQQ